MNAKTNAQGEDRKKLVKAIAEFTGQAAKYNGAPVFTYTVGNITVERDGSITAEDTEINTLAAALREHGFEVEMPETEEPAQEELDGNSWTLTMPREDFTEARIDNLKKIIASKANLIKKALDSEDPIVIVTADRVVLPWFRRLLDADESMAVMHFITALVHMAKSSKRITAKEKEVPNEKYAFRCFLLRLGFIGQKYKGNRKELLKLLAGSSAFRTPKESEA